MTEMTRWWWVRHGPVRGFDGRLYPHEDVDADVSDRGAFTGLANTLPKDAVWVCSPYVRARQTAAAIGEGGLKPEQPMTIEPGLAEQNFGQWAGKTYNDLLDLSRREGTYHNFWLAPAAARPPEGESFTDLVERVGEAVHRITHTFAGANIVAVAHGGTIRAALAAALELDPEKALVFAVQNLSITRIDHFEGDASAPGGVGGNWRVAFVNARPS
jgi:broad specificity phosphatase PhoE